jgi:hypothetical protein
MARPHHKSELAPLRAVANNSKLEEEGERIKNVFSWFFI